MDCGLVIAELLKWCNKKQVKNYKKAITEKKFGREYCKVVWYSCVVEDVKKKV